MWWSSLSVFQQIMFILAVIATFLLLMQIILMIIGGDADNDFSGAADSPSLSDVADASAGGVSDALDGAGDADIPDSPGGCPHGATHFGFRLFSLRAVLAFLSVGGWLGYTLDYTLEWYIALVIAVASGAVAACIVAAALIGMEKLQQNGNLDASNAVGKSAKVYLTVPPARSGKGKVHIVIQERYTEFDAVTDGAEPIPTGADVCVVGRAEPDVLIVEPSCDTVEQKTAE